MRRLQVLLLIVMSVVCIVPLPQIAYASGGNFGGGDGSAEKPYIVEDAADMAAVSNDLTKCYKLSCDINLNGSDSNPWTPIGDMSNLFTGTFDGDGHTISGLYINDSNQYRGLFGAVPSGGTVKNLTVSGTVTGGDFVGGVAGINVEGMITNCCNTASVKATGNGAWVGGVAGATIGSITNCYNTGSVEATGNGAWVGGVAGRNTGSITNCYNTGSVEATGTSALVGGVAGYNDGGSITNCYNTGSVKATGKVGGVVGNNVEGTITNCYYKEGTANGGIQGSDATGQATKLTADQFKVQSNFTDWDFTTIWYMGNEAPLLYNIVVTFDVQGHGTAPDSQKAKEGVILILTAPATPTATGYTFEGWYKESACTNKWNFTSDTVTQSITLYAKWTPVPYTITYTLNGGTATNPTRYTIESPDFTLNNPDKTGYTFSGWTGSNDLTTPQTTVKIAKGSTGDRSYTANFTPTPYTITYTLNEGTATNPTNYTIESEDFKLTNPSLIHKRFTGWTLSGDTAPASTDLTIPKGSIGDRTYIANWTDYSNKYYLYVPESLYITQSGWNPSAGSITASADASEFDSEKSLVVTLTSSPELTPQNPRNFDTIPYAIANVEAKTTPVTSWTISADALTREGGFTQQIGAWVGDFSSKRPDSYSAKVIFFVEVQ